MKTITKNLHMHKIHLKSFSRRIGKTLSKTQLDLIENDLANYKFDPDGFESDYKNFAVEIGIGMAEHFINQAKHNPEILFIGIEPYMNGIANALKLAKEYNVKNIRLWPDDADQILFKLKNATIDRFYLLFPDPWPKTKQKKRRFASQERLTIIKDKLKSNGQFIFASDISDYSEEVYDLLGKISLNLVKEVEHENYVQTKFHKKANEAGRQARFFTFIKL